MKKSFFNFMVAITALLMLSVVSCKKSNSDNEADYTDEFKVQSDDHTFMSSQNDEVTADANTALESDPTLAGRPMYTICGATVATVSNANGRTVTITYNGNNCKNTRKRVGVVELSIAGTNKWKNAGTVLNVKYMNLKITRLANGVATKSLTINGTEMYTNTSGGKLVDVALSNATVIHDITSSGLTLTFDDGTQRSWEISKRKQFTNAGGNVVITTTGTHSDGTNSDIAEWGTNRKGKVFTARIVEPIVMKQDCDFRIGSGKICYTKFVVPIYVTFGLNATGTPTTCPGTGNTYYMKIDWTKLNGNAQSVILPY